jgi:REP-associated tyrosine transposase
MMDRRANTVEKTTVGAGPRPALRTNGANVGAGPRPALRSYRRRLRLPHYDYASAGAYFVTICTHERACLFGHVRDDTMQLNVFGEIVENCWHLLPDLYPRLAADAFIVMPNHVHGIVVLATGSHGVVERRQALPEIVRAFKSLSARRINAIRNATGRPLWQRGYYEHIIRNEISLAEIRDYIAGNPAQWAADRNNPANPKRAGRGPAPTKDDRTTPPDQRPDSAVEAAVGAGRGSAPGRFP